MIKWSTLFILGAGASKDLGYPTGAELTASIVGDFGNFGDQERIKYCQRARGTFINKISQDAFFLRDFNEFILEFKDSGVDSIDSFLTSRGERFKDIGRKTIAGLIWAFETQAHSQLFRLGSWYRYLFGIMCEGCKDFSNFKENNKIRVITFNYDVSFELFLMMACKNNWGISWQEAESILEVIKVDHVHGKVAGRSNEGNSYFRKLIDMGMNYSPALPVHDIPRIAEGIRIYSEEDTSTNCQIKMTYNDIYALGFGFLPENVGKLFPDFSKIGNIDLGGGKIIYSTCFDMLEGEMNVINGNIRSRTLDGKMTLIDGVKFTNGDSKILLRTRRDLLK